MDKYVDLILTKLITKYENSKLSRDGSNRNIRIFVRFDSKGLDDYVSEDSYLYEAYIEDAVRFLEKKELIFVERSEDDLIQRVFLNLEFVDDAYQLLGKVPKRTIYEKYCSLLEKHSVKTGMVGKFCNLMLDRIGQYKSCKAYFNSLEELK